MPRPSCCPLPLLAVLLTGACAGFIMQYWANTWGYSLNIGGRPYFSWPSFVPITFEMMVLTTALTGLFGLLAICGLPRYNHPLFNSKAFDRATRDRFFICIEATDPKYDSAATRAFLNGLHPLSVEEVLDSFDLDVDAYIARRHGELQAEGGNNPAIFERIASELPDLRFRAPHLTPRQIRRRIYG